LTAYHRTVRPQERLSYCYRSSSNLCHLGSRKPSKYR
jgi:hypothetical protein